MEIYVVQPGDTIELIANRYGITVEKLINDNGLLNSNRLVIGQALIILYPTKTYTVKLGDSLSSIAQSNETTVMSLIRNNPFLYDQEYIYPGDTIVISYDQKKDITVNGFAFVFINQDTLKKSLPYITFLSIFNYRIAENANIVNYGDESELISIAKDYSTIPLMMISAFSPLGELNLKYVYDLLLSEKLQDKLVGDMLQIVKAKGFYGINALISNITEENQKLYLNVLTKLSQALRKEGYYFLLTLNPDMKRVNNEVHFENLDYSSLSKIVDRIIFLQNVWSMNKQPPGPISNISLIRPFIDHVTHIISPQMISIGKPLIGFDWTLPFNPSKSFARSMTLDSTITLAYDQSSVIKLDDESQTPYFNYISSFVGPQERHIVWFIDARSINALNNVIIDYDLAGSGLWNLMSFNQQIFSLTNQRFVIIKQPL